MSLLCSAAVVVLLQAPPAWAGGWGGNAHCTTGTYQCTVTATVPGSQPDPTAHTEPVAAGTGESAHCRDIRNRAVPCYDPVLGYFNQHTGCYVALDATFQPPATDAVDQHPPGTGNWYDVTCPGVRGTAGGIVWFATPPAGQPAALPAPAVLAASAAQQLMLGAPTIEASPDADRDQLVSLPTWLWLDSSTASARTATARASNANGSVSVTASARVTKVVWTLGDGTTLVCRGPGTPYTGSGDPQSASPDCGHTYRRSSADAPEGRFPVTATAYWQVRWSGAGQSGALPPVTRTASTSFAVAESQAIND